jgi:hypothetical protein
MQLIVATQALSATGGSESYATTVADHLQRLGHDVHMFALERGLAADLAADLGLRVTGSAADLPPAPDAIISQDGIVAYRLAATHPRTPQVFVAHSDVFDLQLPPALPGVVELIVALYDRVERRVRACAIGADVLRLGQPVDIERFKPTSPPRDRPAVALALGNYLHGDRLALLQRACGRAGIELLHVGRHAGTATARTQDVLNTADIVFGKARVIYEAMACGRTAYVFDHNGAEGWVTNANRAALSADNFGGQAVPIVVDEDRLVADLTAYDPSSGLANRDFIVAHHAATKHAAALAEAARSVARDDGAREPGEPAALLELGRLTRIAHRADAQAFGLNAELGRVTAYARQLEGDLAAERSRSEVVGAAAAEQARDADAARARLAALTTTRRWRTTQRLLRPVDRARAAWRGPQS